MPKIFTGYFFAARYMEKCNNTNCCKVGQLATENQKLAKYFTS